jgi:hypothetical protein
MTAEQGGEASHGHEPGYSPYGLAGQRVGELACILRVRLAAPGQELPYLSGGTPCWTDEDRLAFGYLLDFDDSLPALARKVEDGDIKHDPFPAIDRFLDMPPLIDARFDWHSSTRYEGGWWAWIKAARDAAWGLNGEQALELVKRGGSFPYEEQLIRLRREGYHTDGAAFAHYWTTWRRCLPPFDDVYRHEDAHEALDEIVVQLLPHGR